MQGGSVYTVFIEDRTIKIKYSVDDGDVNPSTFVCGTEDTAAALTYIVKAIMENVKSGPARADYGFSAVHVQNIQIPGFGLPASNAQISTLNFAPFISDLATLTGGEAYKELFSKNSAAFDYAAEIGNGTVFLKNNIADGSWTVNRNGETWLHALSYLKNTEQFTATLFHMISMVDFKTFMPWFPVKRRLFMEGALYSAFELAVLTPLAYTDAYVRYMYMCWHCKNGNIETPDFLSVVYLLYRKTSDPDIQLRLCQHVRDYFTFKSRFRWHEWSTVRSASFPVFGTEKQAENTDDDILLHALKSVREGTDNEFGVARALLNRATYADLCRPVTVNKQQKEDIKRYREVLFDINDNDIASLDEIYPWDVLILALANRRAFTVTQFYENLYIYFKGQMYVKTAVKLRPLPSNYTGKKTRLYAQMSLLFSAKTSGVLASVVNSKCHVSLKAQRRNMARVNFPEMRPFNTKYLSPSTLDESNTDDPWSTEIFSLDRARSVSVPQESHDSTVFVDWDENDDMSEFVASGTVVASLPLDANVVELSDSEAVLPEQPACNNQCAGASGTECPQRPAGSGLVCDMDGHSCVQVEKNVIFPSRALMSPEAKIKHVHSIPWIKGYNAVKELPLFSSINNAKFSKSLKYLPGHPGDILVDRQDDAILYPFGQTLEGKTFYRQITGQHVRCTTAQSDSIPMFTNMAFTCAFDVLVSSFSSIVFSMPANIKQCFADLGKSMIPHSGKNRNQAHIDTSSDTWRLVSYASFCMQGKNYSKLDPGARAKVFFSVKQSHKKLWFRYVKFMEEYKRLTDQNGKLYCEHADPVISSILPAATNLHKTVGKIEVLDRTYPACLSVSKDGLAFFMYELFGHCSLDLYDIVIPRVYSQEGADLSFTTPKSGFEMKTGYYQMKWPIPLGAHQKTGTHKVILSAEEYGRQKPNRSKDKNCYMHGITLELSDAFKVSGVSGPGIIPLVVNKDSRQSVTDYVKKNKTGNGASANWLDDQSLRASRWLMPGKSGQWPPRDMKNNSTLSKNDKNETQFIDAIPPVIYLNFTELHGPDSVTRKIGEMSTWSANLEFPVTIEKTFEYVSNKTAPDGSPKKYTYELASVVYFNPDQQHYTCHFSLMVADSAGAVPRRVFYYHDALYGAAQIPGDMKDDYSNLVEENAKSLDNAKETSSVFFFPVVDDRMSTATMINKNPALDIKDRLPGTAEVSFALYTLKYEEDTYKIPDS